eukprot:TRINITY_DN91280_c0_g1_i1.p1 TRINITY_DN91280_c0_g1~~TRINITY_DN91280_c0_g1_i1.p1  ORF type:complete len:1627 (-),score=488.56 TRINITY_DN91280_c0_g1_i1:226-5106(-)
MRLELHARFDGESVGTENAPSHEAAHQLTRGSSREVNGVRCFGRALRERLSSNHRNRSTNEEVDPTGLPRSSTGEYGRRPQAGQLPDSLRRPWQPLAAHYDKVAEAIRWQPVQHAGGRAAVASSRSKMGSASPTAPRAGIRAQANRFVMFGLWCWACVSMQGCLPPDWSFCDCDFRDNFWNSIISDVNRLWDDEHFIKKVRNNQTWHGSFLGELPKGYDCPVQADRFWKAWPQFGMHRGLIEGSMGDLWMPAARDRIKGTCMAGHFSLCVVCAHHFLVKTAQMQEAGAPDYMRWMEAAYGHMVAIRNLAQASQLRNCMRQQGWSVNVGALHDWTVRWIGRESEGTQPQAAFMNGKVDPYQMMFTIPMAHTEKSRKESLPHRQPCVPFKEPRCWRRMSKLLLETCEHCCSPFIHHGGRGDPTCFDKEWTYERCCHTDYKDLVCRLERKGEEGGCVDCKKTVNYICLTPPERRLHDAQDNYNKEVDRFNNYQEHSKTLGKQAEEARLDLVAKDADYRHKHGVAERDNRIWYESHNNRTRLLSESRLQQQQLTYNSSVKALKVAEDNLNKARAALKNVTTILADARLVETKGKEELKKKVTSREQAQAALKTSLSKVDEAKRVMLSASTQAESADALLLDAEGLQDEQRSLAEAANRTLASTLLATAADYDSALAAHRTAERGHAKALSNDTAAEQEMKVARSQSESAKANLSKAEASLKQVQQEELKMSTARNETSAGLSQIARMRLQKEAALENSKKAEKEVHDYLMGTTTKESKSMRCLIAYTSANATARPSQSALRTVRGESSGGDGLSSCAVEDQNEFCVSWAAEGECEKNPTYMGKACALSCAGKVGMPKMAMPVCSAEVKVPMKAATKSLVPGSLDDLVKELALEEPGSAEDEASSGSGVDEVEKERAAAVSVLTGFEKEVNRTSAALQMAKDAVPQAEKAMGQQEAALAKAVSAKELATKAWEDAETARTEASTVVDTAMKELAAADDFLLERGLDAKAAAKALDNRQEEGRRLQKALEEAMALEKGLEKAQLLAEDEAVQKQEIVSKSRKQVSLLKESIDVLNSSVNENMTTVVSAWLAEQNKEEDTSWGSRLLSAAKSALVSMVSSIELFLESYVISMKDRQIILELVRSVEDHKATNRQLRDAEAALRGAEEQASDAWNSLSKATTARAKIQEDIKSVANLTATAEESLNAANEVVANASAAQQEAAEQLEIAKGNLAEKEALLEGAKMKWNEASAAVKEQEQELQAARTAVEVARSKVVEATAAFGAAKVAHREAVAGASQAFATKLQRHCQATDAEFTAYKDMEALLGFLRAVAAMRTRAVASAKKKHEQTAAAHSKSEVAVKAAKTSVVSAQSDRHKKEEIVNATQAVLTMAEVLHTETRKARAAAETALKARKDRLEEVEGLRRRADVKAKEASTVHEQGKKRLEDTRKKARLSMTQLSEAINATRLREREVVDAELKETQAKENETTAEVEFAMLVESLEFDAKEDAVKKATAHEAKMLSAQQSRSRRERQMQALQETHMQHLRLLEMDIDMANKTTTKSNSWSEFQKAEKAVTEAQKKLDTLVKNEEETHQNIQKSYKDCNRLLEAHTKAQAEFDKQDPKERERSFSTSLDR